MSSWIAKSPKSPGLLGLALLSGALLAGCGSKHTYVLVHGAFADSHAWDRVTPLLEKEGHTVVKVELPAHGEDSTPAAEATLQGYTDTVVKALDAQSDSVILVGHSMGGTVVSQAAEARPDKVRKLVYLAAFMLKDGESLFQVSGTDKDSALGQYLRPSEDGKTLSVLPEAVRDALCNDCSEGDIAYLSQGGGKPEPAAPMATPVRVTGARWGGVPRVYIQTLKDRTISPALQKRLYEASPVEKVLDLDAGHLPFLSQPEALSKLLLSL
jgi:pimeloyl-ACP methyl ester carboxylesterase